MIEKLSKDNIETLPDSYDVKGYINGLDGTTLIFEISSNKSQRIYAYWEPENNHYQSPDIYEVKSVRNILKTIKSEMNLDKLFSDFTSILRPGFYDLGGIIMQKM